MTASSRVKRLYMRMHGKVPEGRVARLHEFATDLAIGFDAGMWDSEIVTIRDRGVVVDWRFGSTDRNVGYVSNVLNKWGRHNLPDFDAMCSVGYFIQHSKDTFTLSDKTLLLADEPPALLNVFISYRRNSSSEFALLLDSRIKHETNATPFVDHNLNPGDEWHAKLEEKIANSGAFICLIAPGTLCSPFVQKEIDWALNDYEEKNRLIIPVWHKSYVSEDNSKCDKISVRFEAVRVLEESAKSYDSAVDEVLNRLGYSTAFLEQRRR